MLQELTNKIKDIIPEIDIPSKIFEGVYKSRPITLEDVLRCLGKVKKLPSLYCVNAFGDIFENYDNKNVLITKWLLGQPLHKQSKETIKELNKLI